KVPDMVGKQSTDAVAALSDAGLKADVHQIASDKPAGQVIAQDPPAGVELVEGSKVRINVSKGAAPVSVPSVVGQSADSANSTLQAAGFTVAAVDVDSQQAKGVVVNQDPAAGTSAAKGTTVTIQVSKGPKTSTVPTVTSQDLQSASQQIHSSGFNVRRQRQDTSAPTQDGIV